MGFQKGQTILLGGFDARNYLNGQEGILLHRDRDTGRCRVRLSDPPWATVKVPMSSVRQSDGRTQTTKEEEVSDLVWKKEAPLRGHVAVRVLPSALPPLGAPAAGPRSRSEQPPVIKHRELYSEMRKSSRDGTRREVSRTQHNGFSFFKEEFESELQWAPTLPRRRRIKRGSPKAVSSVTSAELRSQHEGFLQRNMEEGRAQWVKPILDPTIEALSRSRKDLQRCRRLLGERGEAEYDGRNAEELVEMSRLSLERSTEALRDRKSKKIIAKMTEVAKKADEKEAAKAERAARTREALMGGALPEPVRDLDDLNNLDDGVEGSALERMASALKSARTALHASRQAVDGKRCSPPASPSSSLGQSLVEHADVNLTLADPWTDLDGFYEFEEEPSDQDVLTEERLCAHDHLKLGSPLAHDATVEAHVETHVVLEQCAELSRKSPSEGWDDDND